MEGSSIDKLIVYASHISARLSYIVSTLLPGSVVTDSKESFLSYQGTKINYSVERIDGDSFWIVPYGLLEEQGIHGHNINCSEWQGLKIFFNTPGDLPFDIFSASFFLLSRYEEYWPHELYKYGRYAHTNSVAYTEGFLKFPLVNQWKQLFEMLLERRFHHSSPVTNQSSFRFIPTYDVDIAFSYLHKPLWKNVLGFYRDLLQGKFAQVMERGNVYTGRKQDPYDTFEWMDSLHKKYHLQPIYFFLTIIKRGKYDKNLLASSGALQKLCQSLSAKYNVGVHPSWQSGNDENLLGQEISTLQNITQQKITRSRNHYLRVTVPHTYRRLIAEGITDDYSMAYGTVNGFRASYTLPFRWYDLEKESVTALTIHPFCFMDATSFFDQGYSAQQAAEEIRYYYDEVKKVNGEFITLFHNHFLTEQPEWIAWREMYAWFLEKTVGAIEQPER